jgi:hypothetical protein
MAELVPDDLEALLNMLVPDDLLGSCFLAL